MNTTTGFFCQGGDSKHSSAMSFGLVGSTTRYVMPCFFAVVIGFALFGLAGCTMESSSTSVPSTTVGSKVTGGVHGGQQPVSGAKVYLYAASSSANAGAATPLLAAPGYVLTDSNGGFSITGDYTCPAGTSVYLLALGGNPGLGGSATNAELALGAGLGACSSLTPASFYSVNEATTVALAYSLTSFAVSETQVGAPSAAPLSTAFANVSNFVNPTSGTVNTATASGNGTVPQAKIDSLADALATCVNSDGTGSPCANLMSAANVTAGSTPVDTFQAILNISKNPTTNVAAIFSLVGASGPFQPTLSSAPSDWTLPLQYSSTASITLSPASATILQSGQQEFSATVKGGTTGSYLWTTTANAGVLSEVGGAGQLGKTSYCSISPVTDYVTNSTPVLTKTTNDTVTVQAFTGTGCVSSNALASQTANVAVLQAYTSVVIFGDSYSDNGNFAHLTDASFGVVYPGPDFNYDQGRFTNGPNTTPASQLYSGVMAEQIAATFPAKPAVTDSLDSGSNHAYANATTADGTTTVTVFSGLTITVENLGQQVSDYLAATPVIPSNTLFVMWGGTDELSESSGNSTLSENAAAAREVALVQRLISAGATDILVPNVPPLGALPGYNTASNASALTQAAFNFNQALASGLAGLPSANTAKSLHILPLDVFSLFTATIGPPVGNGFTDAVDSAQGA